MHSREQMQAMVESPGGEGAASGAPSGRGASSTSTGSSDATAAPGPAPAPTLEDFDAIYETHFDLVWRTLRRYGVPEEALDDAAQDVFVVVHKQLEGFEGRSTLKTWVFGIARRVARNHRPTGRSVAVGERLESLGGHATGSDARPAAQVEAAELLHLLLEKLGEEKREAFILVELEQLTIAEAADALEVNRNTMYSRVRAARQELEAAVARLSLQERSELWKS